MSFSRTYMAVTSKIVMAYLNNDNSNYKSDAINLSRETHKNDQICSTCSRESGMVIDLQIFLLSCLIQFSLSRQSISPPLCLSLNSGRIVDDEELIVNPMQRILDPDSKAPLDFYFMAQPKV